jgi:hypothetical protein
MAAMKILFGGFAKVAMWAIIIILIVIMVGTGVPSNVVTIVFAGAVLVSPAIPAILAANGRTVDSQLNKQELRRLIESEFVDSGKKQKWAKSSGIGELNYSLNLSVFPAPVVSVGFTDLEAGGTQVTICMSEWTSGGFEMPFFWAADPFWHHGASRVLSKIKTVAARIEGNSGK